MRARPVFLHFLCTLLALVLAPSAFAQKYQIVDLGPWGENATGAVGINDSGTVVGSLVTVDDYIHACSYANGILTDIGTLGLDFSTATGINNAGTIIGWSYALDNQGNPVIHAFFWKNGTMTDLTPGSSQNVFAYGINTAGVIVGKTGMPPDQVQHAFAYENGVMSDLNQRSNGQLNSSYTYAYAINDNKIVVGDTNKSGGILAFTYDLNTNTVKTLGTLGGFGYSTARGINNSGTIVGAAVTADNTVHAFSYAGGTMQDLGTLSGSNSFANAINANGIIVGYADTFTPNEPHAFIYENGSMTDLNHRLLFNSGWVLESATAINNSGWIVGSGLRDGEAHAYLLRPIRVVQVPSVQKAPQ